MFPRCVLSPMSVNCEPRRDEIITDMLFVILPLEGFLLFWFFNNLVCKAIVYPFCKILIFINYFLTGLSMWAGPLIYLWPPCLNNPIFSNLGLCAACWAPFMCHHELWPTSVGHPFSFLNGSRGLTGGKYYQKITIVIFRFVLPNFTIPGCFPYILF